jgi:CBS domain-containing protein
MVVRDVLRGKTKAIVTVGPDAGIDEAMRLMVKYDIGCLPVVTETGSLLGLITDRAIFRKIHEQKEKYLTVKVNDIMTSEVSSGNLDEDMAYIAEKMRKCWTRYVPIVDDDRVIGVVSLWDVLKAKSKAEMENRYLKLYIDEQFAPGRAGED